MPLHWANTSPIEARYENVYVCVCVCVFVMNIIGSKQGHKSRILYATYKRPKELYLPLVNFIRLSQ